MAPNHPSSDSPKAAPGIGLVTLWMAVLSFVVFFGPGADAVSATEPASDEPSNPAEVESEAETEVDSAAADELRAGQLAYSQICSSCHQPGGAGLPGQYPPLIDNPHVDDAAYVREVIENGRQGQIEVNGEVFDGVMPSFSTLSDDETDAIVAYIQADFMAPAGEAAAGPTGPVAGTELPALTNMGAIVAYLLAAGVAALVLAPRLLSENSRLDTPWLDAWLKTAVIVASTIFLTVVVPDWAVKNSTVTKLSRFAQDLIGVSLWLFGMAAIAWSLWYAHGRSRV